MIHSVYVTTNLKTKCFYIGKHSTKNLKDGYQGSGVWVKNEKKLNSQLFTRTMKEFDNEDDAYAYEVYAIKMSKDIYPEFCKNVRDGGWGLKTKANHHYFGQKLSDAHVEKMRIAHLNKPEKRSRKVLCIETGVIYDSLSIAARLGVGKINSRVEIRKCCLGLVKSANGFSWKFAD